MSEFSGKRDIGLRDVVATGRVVDVYSDVDVYFASQSFPVNGKPRQKFPK